MRLWREYGRLSPPRNLNIVFLISCLLVASVFQYHFAARFRNKVTQRHVCPETCEKGWLFDRDAVPQCQTFFSLPGCSLVAQVLRISLSSAADSGEVSSCRCSCSSPRVRRRFHFPSSVFTAPRRHTLRLRLGVAFEPSPRCVEMAQKPVGP